MTPLPHANEPAAQTSERLSVVAAEHGLASGIPLRPRRVTMTAPRRPDRTAQRRRADSSGSTSSCSPTRSKTTFALIVTHSRVVIRSPRLRTPSERRLKRLAADPHVLLAVAVVLAALFIELATRGNTLLVVAPALVYLALQIGFALRGRTGRSTGVDTARLLLALAAVVWMSFGTGNPATLPVASLTLPIVVMAAALGARQVIVVGTALITVAAVMYLSPALSASRRLVAEVDSDQAVLERFLRDTSQVVAAVADRRTDLSALVGRAQALLAMNRDTEALAALEAVLVVDPSLPTKNVQELIALAKSKPGKLNYASAGNGSTHHFCGELLKSMSGADMVHVPYKGSPPAITGGRPVL